MPVFPSGDSLGREIKIIIIIKRKTETTVKTIIHVFVCSFSAVNAHRTHLVTACLEQSYPLGDCSRSVFTTFSCCDRKLLFSMYLLLSLSVSCLILSLLEIPVLLLALISDSLYKYLEYFTFVLMVVDQRQANY